MTKSCGFVLNVYEAMTYNDAGDVEKEKSFQNLVQRVFRNVFFLFFLV